MLATEIPCNWTRTVDPVLEPITLAQAKAQMRITDEASNESINNYIRTARDAAENYLGRGLLTQTWKLMLERFSNVMPLPMAAPLQSVTSVKYWDGDGVQQTLATSVYDTDLVSRPGAVVLKPGQSWPAVQDEKRNGRVEIIYVVGFTTQAAVPELIKQGIRMFVTYLDLDRDGVDATAALNARAAAERCWADRVYWTPPEC